MTTTMMMMIGNLLRVKDLLPTNGEDSSRARAYACAPHHLSIANTKKRPARDDPARRQKKRRRLDRKEREREREREKQKKSAAHLLLVTTRIGRHYIRGIGCCVDPNTHKLERRQNATRRRPLLLFRERKRAVSVSTFCFFPPLMVVCPPRRGGGGGVNNDLGRPSSV